MAVRGLWKHSRNAWNEREEFALMKSCRILSKKAGECAYSWVSYTCNRIAATSKSVTEPKNEIRPLDYRRTRNSLLEFGIGGPYVVEAVCYSSEDRL